MMVDLFSSLEHTSMMIWFIPLMLVLLLLSNLMLLSSVNWLILGMFVFFMNMSGLMPYSFGSTTNPMFVLLMALGLWMTGVLMRSILHFSETMGSLTPSGSPFMLAPFLAVIELVSLLIRPLTLTLRLVANLSAGHIFLALMANTIGSLIGVFYYQFEIFVSIIQAYVFTLLLIMYQNE